MKTFTSTRLCLSTQLKKVFTIFLGVFFVPLLLMASHFRYGSISWSNTTGNTVVFRISQAWRMSAFFSGTPAIGAVAFTGESFNYGDGAAADINLTVTSVNPTEDWFFGEITLTHTYPSVGTRTAFAESCCRISNLQNNADGNWRIQSTVNVGSGNSSPVTTIVPIIDVPANNSGATFNIGATDPNGSVLRFRLSTSAEAGPGFTQPTGLTINSASGQMTFNTVGKSVGQLYTTQLMISDGTVESPLDFIIRIANVTGTPPFFVSPPTPNNGQVYFVNAGSNVNFLVQAADNDAGSIVNLSVAGAPPGSTFTPPLPAISNPVSTTFSWNTTATNVGSYVLNFNAIDNTGATANRSVTINVVSPNNYYSKSTGDLHNLLTWGVNPDGSGANPPDFALGNTGINFNLANRPSLYTMTADWTVGGVLNIPSASQLEINGFTLSFATLNGQTNAPCCSGTISGSLTSNLILTGFGSNNLRFTPSSNRLNNFTLRHSSAFPAGTPSAELSSLLDIYGVFTMNGGTITSFYSPLGMFFPITLKSSALNTARVAPILSGDVSGLGVIVERYIPARRAWRVLSAPVGTLRGAPIGQTINQDWQEGVTTASANPNPAPGYGTHITGGPQFGSVANGFDQNPGASSSILTYNSTIDNWVPVPTTFMGISNPAYFLFVRGDRGIPLGLNTVPPTATTLRARGSLKTGDQFFGVSPTGFTAIANPFASPIDYATITRNNVQNNFYLWDPKMGGLAGVGGYVLVSFNGSTYDVTPASVSPESQYIQSGQGFLVHSTGSLGSIIIKESDKSATPATDVFRTSSDGQSAHSNTTQQGLRVTLKTANADNTTDLLDEVFSSYSSKFSNKLDNMDALKLPNIHENLGITRDNETLMVERREGIAAKDTIRLKLWNTEQKDYVLEFNPINLASTTGSALLVDNYLRISTPVSLTEVSQLSFTTNADVASANQGRFMIVFSKGGQSNLFTMGDIKGITTFPNPISGKILNLQMANQPEGTYAVELINSVGQVVYKGTVKHAQGSSTETRQFNNKLASGLYQMKITQRGTTTTLKVIANN